jgi:hypothetical protein
VKSKKVLWFFLKRYRGFCPILTCALDGDILVVKQRDVFYNAPTQTFLIQIYNNAFVVSGNIALFKENEKDSYNKSLAILCSANRPPGFFAFSHRNSLNRLTAKQQMLQYSLNGPLCA